MKFWKVFYSGKRNETVLTDCGGSYTVSATSEEQAQEEAASMAHQDGITEVSIESCAPLQNEEAWTSEGFTSTTDYPPFSSISTYVVTDFDGDPYVSYTSTSGHHDNCEVSDEEYEETWLEDWIDEPVYIPYSALADTVEVQQDNNDTCTTTTLSGYTSYSGFTGASKLTSSPSGDDKTPKAYQEPWGNGYYSYKITNRINLTKQQQIKLKALV